MENTNVIEQNLIGTASKGFTQFAIEDLIARYADEHKQGSRQENPALANITDLVPWAIYDRNTTAAGAATSAQYVFFNQPIGTNNKTKVDTNLEQVMALPNPEWMDVQKLAFTFAGNIADDDAFSMLANYYFEFWVGGKIYAEGPLEIAAGKTGLYGFNAQTNSANLTLGQPVDNDGGFDLRLPPGIQLTSPDGAVYMTDGVKGCRILQGQQFQVKVIGTSFTAAAAAGTTFGTGVNFRCFLRGIKSRIAQ